MKHSKKHDDNPFKEMQNDENQSIKETNAEAQEIKADNSAELNDLKAKYDVLNQQYIRLAADFDNYRKRQESERESLLKYGSENALKKMLEILDNFERGEKALENVEDCQTVKDSFNLVHKQVLETLQKLGLEQIVTENQEFNPSLHDAVMQTPTDDVEENYIINELQKGYKLADKVLRPALVNVATKP